MYLHYCNMIALCSPQQQFGSFVHRNFPLDVSLWTRLRLDKQRFYPSLSRLSISVECTLRIQAVQRENTHPHSVVLPHHCSCYYLPDDISATAKRDMSIGIIGDFQLRTSVLTLFCVQKNCMQVLSTKV